jgi:hypothetical protein
VPVTGRRDPLPPGAACPSPSAAFRAWGSESRGGAMPHTSPRRWRTLPLSLAHALDQLKGRGLWINSAGQDSRHLPVPGGTDLYGRQHGHLLCCCLPLQHRRSSRTPSSLASTSRSRPYPSRCRPPASLCAPTCSRGCPCTQHGNFLTDSFVRRKYYQLLDQVSLPRIHFHDLRHSTATIQLAMGVNIKVVQEPLGHSQVTVTLGIYGHVLPEMQGEALRKMEELLRGEQNK